MANSAVGALGNSIGARMGCTVVAYSNPIDVGSGVGVGGDVEVNASLSYCCS